MPKRADISMDPSHVFPHTPQEQRHIIRFPHRLSFSTYQSLRYLYLKNDSNNLSVFTGLAPVSFPGVFLSPALKNLSKLFLYSPEKNAAISP